MFSLTLNSRQSIIALLAVMAGLIIAVAAVTIFSLYYAEFEDQRNHLVEKVRTQARMIDAAERLNANADATKPSQTANASVLALAFGVGQRPGTFGDTGAFMLGRQTGGIIEAVFTGSRAAPGEPRRLDAAYEEPMRQALLQQTGTIQGTDRRGVAFLAAYMPVKSLNMGLVAKIDLAEIRAPFIKAGAVNIAAVVIFVFVGWSLFGWIGLPLLNHFKMTARRLSEAQRVAHIGYWEVDLETDKLWGSEEIYRMRGVEFAPTPVALDFFRGIIHPDDRNRVNEAQRRATETGTPFHTDYRIIRPNGDERIVRTQGEVSRDKAGNPIRVSGTDQDVTERREAEQQSRESERRLRAIIDNAPAVIYLKDAEGRYILVNKHFDNLFQERRGSFLGKTDHEMIPKARADAFRQHDQQVLSTGMATTNEESAIQPGGNLHTYLSVKFPVFNGDGKTVAVGGVSTDITERKRSESEVRKARDGLETRIAERTRALTEEITERKQVQETLRASERQMHLMINSLPAFVAYIDTEQRYRFTNTRYAEWFGKKTYDIIGRQIRNIIGEARYRNIRGPLERSLRGETVQFEFTSVSPSGQITHLNAIYSPNRDETGAITGMFAFVRDVTARKQADEKLRASEERYHQVLDNLADGALTIDSRGLIDYANPEAERIFGYALDAMTGRNVSMLMPEPDHGKHDTYLANYRETGDAKIIGIGREVSGLRKDGTTFPLELAITEAMIDGKTVFLGTVRDITVRKQAENELIMAKLGAEAANRAKSDFLANMSHEFRTPLNAIIGFSDMTKRELLGPIENKTYTAYAKDIYQSGVHLLDLISNILDVSVIEAGEMKLHESEVDIANVISAVTGLLGPRVDDKDIQLYTVTEDAFPLLLVDELKLKQIFLNLLSNAIKFTQQGGTVTIANTRSQNGGVHIRITDTGCGMDEKGIATALLPFGRIESPFHASEEGTGLGLPLTLGLVEAHGGTMTITSELTVGTTVQIEFPESRIVRRAATSTLAAPLTRPTIQDPSGFQRD